MATIKSFTTLEQSKKLAEILPIESADAFYPWRELMKDYDSIYVPEKMLMSDIEEDDILAWSLAALIDIASTYCNRLEITLRTDKKYNVFAVKNDFVFRSFDDHPDGFDNLIDACVVMIEKLNELKML